MKLHGIESIFKASGEMADALIERTLSNVAALLR
jgi:hypothetical protein